MIERLILFMFVFQLLLAYGLVHATLFKRNFLAELQEDKKRTRYMLPGASNRRLTALLDFCVYLLAVAHFVVGLGYFGVFPKSEITYFLGAMFILIGIYVFSVAKPLAQGTPFSTPYVFRGIYCVAVCGGLLYMFYFFGGKLLGLS